MQEYSRVHIVTLRQVWTDYLKTGRLKPNTQGNYEYRIFTHLRSWVDLPITSITKEMVETRHREISQLGKPLANSVFRTLKAMLTFAEAKYDDEDGQPLLKRNPVKHLSSIRAWNREKRRSRVIRPQQLRAWFAAVFQLENSTLRDMLIFLLLTGLRRNEARMIRWDQVNLETGIIYFRDTKNGDDFELPLSNYVWQMLSIRKLGAKSEFVFPGRKHNQPTTIAFRSYAAVRRASGVEFSLHDLRRTFITLADELDLKKEVVKGLVNHRSADVTEGYTIRSVERLRRASQKITDFILQCGGLRKTV